MENSSDDNQTSPADMGGSCAKSPCGTSHELPDQYVWEQKVLDDTLMPAGGITHSAIVSYSDGQLRAAAPRGFNPDRTVLKNIVAGLKGDTSGLLETGIDLGSGSKPCAPGKLDAGRAIFGSNGQGGGCAIFKSEVCVLVALYDHGATHAIRMAREVSEYMEEQHH